MAADIFAIVNRKGGVGKTTTAVTLAHGLSRKLMEDERDESVLLVDLDPQGNSAMSLGVQTNDVCISRLLIGEASLEEVILSTDRSGVGGPERPNLYLIPATDQLADIKVELVAAAAIEGILRQLSRRRREEPVRIADLLNARLADAAKVFRYILLDCPPTLDLFEESVYRFAEAAVVPVKVDYLGTAGAARHTQGILEAQAAGIDIRIAMVVPTFMRPRQSLAKQMLASLIQTFGAQRVSEPIPTSVQIEEAPAAGGLTIFEYAPESKPARAYWNLVEKIYHG